MWRVYQVVFRLRSPLHIGWGKVGNLQRTRHYVIGRTLWGALTMRLTRDRANGRGPATDSRDYRQVGRQVHQSLSFTYFYPATKSEDDYHVAWPWLDEDSYRSRFLGSYSGTALSHPYRTVAMGTLHEVEFISPNTLDRAEPVFLYGYVFDRVDNELAWQAALKRLQIGGERGYGWGDVELIHINEVGGGHLFGGIAAFEGGPDGPIVRLSASEQTPGRLLAHTLAADLPTAVEGEIEPLVGREWRSDGSRYHHAGQHVAFDCVCFTPGSRVNQTLSFAIGDFGLWRCI